MFSHLIIRTSQQESTPTLHMRKWKFKVGKEQPNVPKFQKRLKLNSSLFTLNPWPLLLYFSITPEGPYLQRLFSYGKKIIPRGQTEVFQFEAYIFLLIMATHTHYLGNDSTTGQSSKVKISVFHFCSPLILISY